MCTLCWRKYILNLWLCKEMVSGNSLKVQWLGLSAFTTLAWVPSLAGELRSCKPRSVAKKKKSFSMQSVIIIPALLSRSVFLIPSSTSLSLYQLKLLGDTS